MRNLNDEYISVNTIYKQQKEYRQTTKGKRALQRARERQTIKKMVVLYCESCNESEFEVLTIYNNKTLCYNCRYRRPHVLEECEVCL